MRRALVVASVVLVLVAGVVSVAAACGGDGESCVVATDYEIVSKPGRWSVVASGKAVPLLRGVAAISPTDVWAVGGRAGSKGKAAPVIVHWDGTRLRSYPAFKPSDGHHGALMAVSAVDSRDVWAVGVDGDGWGRPVVMHWDGSVWQTVATPRLRAQGELRGVVALSSDDVWAVGQIGDAYGPESRPLVMHWDGSGWLVIDLRRVVRSPSGLSAVDASSSRDVWAVGTQGYADHMGAESPLALHWNGNAISEVASVENFDRESGTNLSRVDVLSARALFTLGASWDGDGGYSSLNEWGGSRQRVLHVFSEGYPSDVAAVSRTDIWVVGTTPVSDDRDRPFAARWNGQSLDKARTPFDKIQNATLEDLSVVSPDEMWAVGDHLIARYTR